MSTLRTAVPRASPVPLFFAQNASTALNAVLRSLPLRAGDEIVVTDHEYNATRNAAERAARERGARVVLARIPFPLPEGHGAEQVVDAVLRATGPRTRLAVVDHVTSQTGLVLPIERLVGELHARGIEVLVDGAHAPGMLPLDLRALGAEYLAGNCHKWLCAPKGAGFLFVRRDRQDRVHPTVTSHGANAPVAAGPARFRANDPDFKLLASGKKVSKLMGDVFAQDENHNSDFEKSEPPDLYFICDIERTVLWKPEV